MVKPQFEDEPTTLVKPKVIPKIQPDVTFDDDPDDVASAPKTPKKALIHLKNYILNSLSRAHYNNCQKATGYTKQQIEEILERKLK